MLRPSTDARDRDALAGLDRVLEAFLALVLDEGVERADDADLGLPAHVPLDVLEEKLADLLARRPRCRRRSGCICRPLGQQRVDRDDRDAGLRRLLDRRHDAVDVDGDDDDAVHLLGDVGLDRVVLRRRVVVGVEDDELRALLLGGRLGAVVHLVEEQGLLVDGHQRDGRLGGAGWTARKNEAAGEREPGGREATAQHRSSLPCAPDGAH